jgi:rod shape-determining protein MreC
LCELLYVAKEEDFIIGDVLVASGLGKSFPEGVKIGTVVQVNNKTDGLSMEIKVKPFVDVFKVQEVIVVGK